MSAGPILRPLSQLPSRTTIWLHVQLYVAVSDPPIDGNPAKLICGIGPGPNHQRTWTVEENLACSCIISYRGIYQGRVHISLYLYWTGEYFRVVMCKRTDHDFSFSHRTQTYVFQLLIRSIGAPLLIKYEEPAGAGIPARWFPIP